MRLGTAIERLIGHYQFAKDQPIIKDKVAWALYHTWRDAEEGIDFAAMEKEGKNGTNTKRKSR